MHDAFDLIGREAPSGSRASQTFSKIFASSNNAVRHGYALMGSLHSTVQLVIAECRSLVHEHRLTLHQAVACALIPLAAFEADIIVLRRARLWRLSCDQGDTCQATAAASGHLLSTLFMSGTCRASDRTAAASPAAWRSSPSCAVPPYLVSSFSAAARRPGEPHPVRGLLMTGTKRGKVISGGR